MSITHAVLYQTSSGEYGIYKGDTSLPGAGAIPPYLEQFLPIFEQHQIDVLWVMPNTALSKHISWDQFDKIDRGRCRVFPNRPEGSNKKPSFVSIRRQNTGRYEPDRYLAFPGHAEWNADSDDGLWFLPSPHVLLQTISYLESEYGLDVLWSPGNMGTKVRDRLFQKRKWTFENTVMTDKLHEVFNLRMRRPIWKRYGGLSDEQKRMKYVHGVDKNGQYLGAAGSVLLGSGQAQETTTFDPKAVGFWKYRVTDVGDSAFDSDDLYCPLDPELEYASTDLINAARAVGIKCDISEGLVWKTSGKYLEKWAQETWSHRSNLRDEEKYQGEIARENAAGTAKLSGNSMMGLLAAPLKGQTSRLFRPDWNELIVHRAISNQTYTHNKLQRDFGIKPVLVSTDTFWVVSDEPDPAKAIPGLLEHATEQRGWKLVATVKMSDEIIHLFDTEGPEVINGYLKKYPQTGR